MSKPITAKRKSSLWMQAAAIVVIGGLAGAAHAASSFSFIFFAQGPEKPFNISKVVSGVTKRATGAGVCNAFGAGIDVRTITSSTTATSDILVGCTDGSGPPSGVQHVAGTTTTTADNIWWCFLNGSQGSLIQAGIGI
jgi:hypothetical protein